MQVQATGGMAEWRAGERPSPSRAHAHAASHGRLASGAPRSLPSLRRARRSRSLPLFLFGLIGAGAFALLTDGGRTARAALPLTEQIDTLLVDAGFGINEVRLTGHRYTVDSDIFAALDEEKTGSLLRFDPRQARHRIEQLSWVETAAVTRVFPDQLRIDIKERQPFAVWINGGREALVDPSGRLLAYVTHGAASELPRIRGAEAPAAAAELFAALRRHPGIAQRLETADRIGGRRWTLRLDSSVAVHLPAEGQAAAIDRLADLQARQGLLDQGNLVADLRLAHRIAIRRTGVLVGGNGQGAGSAPGDG